MDSGIFAVQFIKQFSDQLHGVGFAAAQIYVSGDARAHGVKLGFGFIHHFHNFFGAAAEEDAFLSQSDGMIGADKKFLPQFVLQIHKLS